MSEEAPAPARQIPRVAVVGAAAATPELYERARALGRALGEGGAAVICGGLGGVMEAAARGAREAGALTLGVLPGADAGAANPWIVLPLPTGLGEARNVLVVGFAQAVVAVGGSWGTLSEIALAKKKGLEVALLGPPPVPGLALPTFDEPREAARWALERAASPASTSGVGTPPTAPSPNTLRDPS